LSFKEAERANELADPGALREPISPAFSCELVRGKHEMHWSVAARIYKNGAQTFACGAGFQAVNGCAAQPSRRLLTLGPKTCSLFALITTGFM
jgi:hypothetical protein